MKSNTTEMLDYMVTVYPRNERIKTPKFRKEKSKQEIPTASFVTPKEIPQNIGIEIERTAEGYVVKPV